jgi:hypothetical protein
LRARLILLRVWRPKHGWSVSVYVSDGDRVDETCVRREVVYGVPIKERLCHSIKPNLTCANPNSLVCLFLSFSWTPNLLSLPCLLPLLVIVHIENASQSPGSPPTPQLPSQLIFAPKSPLTTNHQIIQRAPTKPTPTPAIPLPKTPSFHSPRPVLAGSARTGDAAPSHQPCHLRRILT